MDQTGYHFWFGARRFQATSPSMTVADIKKMTNASPGDHFFRERKGQSDLGIGDGELVDLKGEPHFWSAPAATMFG